MQQKSISGRDLSKTVTSEDLLGKEVIDLNGTFIGVVEKVLMDPNKLEFIGISIDKGFLKKGLTIGKSYISKVTPHAVFLRIKVSYNIKGKTVFDNEGHVIGKVYSIELHGNKNKIINIIVRRGLSDSLFGTEIVIPAEYIKDIGENVMLNVSKNKLKKSKSVVEV